MNKLLNSLKKWYGFYGYPGFYVHKFTHIIVGFVVGFVISWYGYPLPAALWVGVIAIGKEIADHMQLESDPTNPVDEIQYHTYDVIVTALGGALGILLGVVL